MTGQAPRFLREEEAAAYLGVSVSVFRCEVEAGAWPRPVRRGARPGKRGGVLTWDRKLLDAAADALADLPGPETDATRAAARQALQAATMAAAERD